ncbi:MAG: hypothetical protein HY828_02380 [Actinobacteria bacterium]|nr:hypothetical protein [Actinomycetota bacterium]
MTEPTTEEKIQLLVKSVLEAVDARLDTVRHELATFSNDVEQRHHQLLESMAALDARITELAAGPTSPPDAAATARLTADLEALRLQVESLASRPAPAPPAALADAPAPAAALVLAPAAEVAPDVPEPADPAVVTGSHQITREELDEISRPIVTHITTQVPVVPDPTKHHDPVEHMPLRVPPMVTPHFGTPHAAPVADEHGDVAAPAGDEIDLDQLASLLNARLGSLSLPTRHD